MPPAPPRQNHADRQARQPVSRHVPPRLQSHRPILPGATSTPRPSRSPPPIYPNRDPIRLGPGRGTPTPPGLPFASSLTHERTTRGQKPRNLRLALMPTIPATEIPLQRRCSSLILRKQPTPARSMRTTQSGLTFPGSNGFEPTNRARFDRSWLDLSVRAVSRLLINITIACWFGSSFKFCLVWWVDPA